MDKKLIEASDDQKTRNKVLLKMFAKVNRKGMSRTENIDLSKE